VINALAASMHNGVPVMQRKQRCHPAGEVEEEEVYALGVVIRPLLNIPWGLKVTSRLPCHVEVTSRQSGVAGGALFPSEACNAFVSICVVFSGFLSTRRAGEFRY